MKLLINLIFTLYHFILVITIIGITLLSNNENLIFFTLLLMILIKYCFFIFKRCIITDYEFNKIYLSISEVGNYLLIKKNMKTNEIEEIIINMSLLLLIIKLLIIIFIKYNFNSFSSYLQNLIYKYIYNNVKF